VSERLRRESQFAPRAARRAASSSDSARSFKFAGHSVNSRRRNSREAKFRRDRSSSAIFPLRLQLNRIRKHIREGFLRAGSVSLSVFSIRRALRSRVLQAGNQFPAVSIQFHRAIHRYARALHSRELALLILEHHRRARLSESLLFISADHPELHNSSQVVANVVNKERNVRQSQDTSCCASLRLQNFI